MAKKEIKNTKSSIEETLAGLEKTFGKGSIMLMNDSNSSHEEGVIPTGSVVLDLALGIGGLPRGRIIEIFGAESAGKTTLALSAVAQAQKLGGTAAYIDVEHALDPSYSQKIGIDLPMCILKEHPRLLEDNKKLKPIKHSKVFGFVFYMPPIQDYQTRIHDFHRQYSDLGRVYL